MKKTSLKPTYFKSGTFGERPCGLNKRSKSSCRCSGITVYYLAPNLREFLHKTVWAWACLFARRTRWCLGQPAAKMQFLQAGDWLRFKREQIDQRWLTARPSGLPRNSGGKVRVKTCCQRQSQKNLSAETHWTKALRFSAIPDMQTCTFIQWVPDEHWQKMEGRLDLNTHTYVQRHLTNVSVQCHWDINVNAFSVYNLTKWLHSLQAFKIACSNAVTVYISCPFLLSVSETEVL